MQLCLPACLYRHDCGTWGAASSMCEQGQGLPLCGVQTHRWLGWHVAGAHVYGLGLPHAGLAPHYDDVEIFVAQAEGSKRWCLYRPQVG